MHRFQGDEFDPHDNSANDGAGTDRTGGYRRLIVATRGGSNCRSEATALWALTVRRAADIDQPGSAGSIGRSGSLHIPVSAATR